MDPAQPQLSLMVKLGIDPAKGYAEAKCIKCNALYRKHAWHRPLCIDCKGVILKTDFRSQEVEFRKQNHQKPL